MLFASCWVTLPGVKFECGEIQRLCGGNPIAVNPTSGAYFNLASLSEAQGKYEDAIAFYRQALAINPHRWQAHEESRTVCLKSAE